MHIRNGRRLTKPKDTRRRHTDAFKQALVERSLVPGASVAVIAQDAGINANQLFNWRRLRLQAAASTADAEVVLLLKLMVQKPRLKLARRNRSLPAYLPRDEQVHRPATTDAHHDNDGQACGCSACGGRLRCIGADVSEQLEYVPPHFKVIRHVRPQLACVKCQGTFQAEAPSRPIVRALPGPGLLAHVMVSKYCGHIPLYRQSRIHAREGVDIDRPTMTGWVARGDELIDPLLVALGRYVLAADKVHADDTPVKVLDPGAGKTKSGRLWVYVRDDRPAGSPAPAAAWYRYSPDRKGEHPRDHLKQYHGILQADAYGGWIRLYGSGVTEAACWAHARRPRWDLYQSSGRAPDSLAAQALRRIRALYEIEAEIRGQPPDVRREQREARAAPLLKDMHVWLTGLAGRVSAKSEIAQAIGYSLVRWTALTRYVDDGRIEIDNSAAERALRCVAWLCDDGLLRSLAADFDGTIKKFGIDCQVGGHERHLAKESAHAAGPKPVEADS